MSNHLGIAPFVQHIQLILKLTPGQFFVLVQLYQTYLMLAYASMNSRIFSVILQLQILMTIFDWSSRTFYVPGKPLTGIAFESCAQELYLGFGVFTPKRPCSLNYCTIPVTNISYTSRSKLPEYSSGGLIFNLILVMIEYSGFLSPLSFNALHTMCIIGS